MGQMEPQIRAGVQALQGLVREILVVRADLALSLFGTQTHIPPQLQPLVRPQ
jgi:hypothetical protein